ncbi:MAG: caspase family protein [Moraxellaceae bacterium]|nr:caspase family protein [Moraxellaceae bacterium]
MSQKALLFLDVCHAGSVGGEVKRRGNTSSNDVVNLLANGTGVKVIASSQGREFSLENANFGGGHGAFTQALLEALAGEADKKGDKDNVVSVLELESYVSGRVPEITNGKQHPMTPYADRFQDYPISYNP